MAHIGYIEYVKREENRCNALKAGKTMVAEDIVEFIQNSADLIVEQPAWYGHEYAISFHEVTTHMDGLLVLLKNEQKASKVSELRKKFEATSSGNYRDFEEIDRDYFEIYKELVDEAMQMYCPQ